MSSGCPSRIVCLSAEAVDVLYRLGCGRRVVGVTAFAADPVAARRKPRVSGFSSFNYDRIDSLKPDLVITFSDVQADAARELIRRGHTVLATNQRSLAEVYEVIHLIGRIVGREAAALKLVEEMRRCVGQTFLSAGLGDFPVARRDTGLESPVNRQTGMSALRPRVYFEEWNDPLISGIGWVSELIEAAGGVDVFSELRDRPRASDRVVTPEEVLHRQPDIIVASWCGKAANLKSIARRSGWEGIPAVRFGRIYEIESAHILQPGPALLKGFRELRKIVRQVS